MKPKFFIFSLIFVALFSGQIFAQKNLLQSGPMVGYSEMYEVMLWVQTTESAVVQISYYPTDDKKNVSWTDEIITKKESGFKAHLLADEVVHNKIYEYDLYINGKKISFDYKTEFQTPVIWKYRTDPPTFKFATGSCAYINDKEYDRPGKGYGGDYQIFEHLYKTEPDFMVWLGDNVYYRQRDCASKTGMMRRYTHGRSLPEIQPLLASVHHYAIWDDHDYGPNNSDGSFWNKETSLEVFEHFWANPSYGVGEAEGAITFFEWGDVEFFMLDNRYNRDPNDLKAENKTILGEAQKDWLKKALINSRASFKFVIIGGQFLSEAAIYETYTNYGFEGERQEIIDFIYSQNIKNVVFISGDRHHTELSMLKAEGKPTIYDLTVSPFTSGASLGADEENPKLRVDGTHVEERNFATLELSGKRKARKLNIKIFNANGKELWTHEINQE